MTHYLEGQVRLEGQRAGQLNAISQLPTSKVDGEPGSVRTGGGNAGFSANFACSGPDSGASRSLIPEEADHRFRSMPINDRLLEGGGLIASAR